MAHRVHSPGWHLLLWNPDLRLDQPFLHQVPVALGQGWRVDWGLGLNTSLRGEGKARRGRAKLGIGCQGSSEAYDR